MATRLMACILWIFSETSHLESLVLLRRVGCEVQR